MRIAYIAGPMTGQPEFNRPAFFAAEGKLLQLGYIVLNPARNFGGNVTLPYSVYLRAGIEDLFHATTLALLDGSEESQGARIEKAIAEALSLEIINL